MWNFLNRNDIDATEAKELISKGAILIDVREPIEYKQHHIRGSKNIPLGLIQNNIDQIDKNKTIVTYCRSGNRSSVAKRILESSGFKDVLNLSGGITSWIKKGFEVI